MTTPSTSSNPQLSNNDANNNNNLSSNPSKATRRQKSDERIAQEEEERKFPRFVFDPDSGLVCYWTAAVALVTLYNAWTIALRIAFPEMRVMNDQSYLPIIDVLCDLVYVLDIFMQLRTAYLQDGIPVFDPQKIRQNYMSQTYFIQDVICVLPSHTLLSLLPDEVEFCKYFLCSAGAARLTKLLKFHILYKFYDLAESFTSNPHLIRVLRLFLNLAIIIHWIACLYYLLSEYEGLGSNDWVYTNATDQQRFSRKYLKCLYWSAMTLTTIGDTNTPETDLEYIFTGVIFLTGVFVFATVMGNVGDVISSMNANRQEFQARMDHIQMYLTHKKVPASLQLKIKKWAEYTWSRTKATDESRLLNMLPERLRAEVAVHVHLDSLKKVKIFEQCETGFLCELVLKLRSQVFSPGDYVCRVGETGREMFIINHGKVEVIVNNPATFKPMVVAVLSEGNYFGEISLLRLDGVQNSSFFNRRTADVRSIGYSELLCLSRRDLMAALVEYPEAKSVLEDQAKKRMKTNLQAQRAFSVDTLLRSSQEQSSMDSGIVKDEIIGQDVSEIKAMIEELKNANKAPGKSVWQMIAKCEVLQAKLTEKEKEVEDSKNRIRDLETLLYSRHKSLKDEEDEELDAELMQEDEEDHQKPLRRNSGNVTRQYSQDEGRPGPFPHLPDVKVTPSSEADDSSDEAPRNDFIKTSKITNIFEKRQDARKRVAQGKSSKVLVEDMGDNFNDDWTYNYTNETSIDHEICFDDQQISMTTRFRDEFHLGESLDLNVHTIFEENEEESLDTADENVLLDEKLKHRHYSNTENVLLDQELKNRHYTNSENVYVELEHGSYIENGHKNLGQRRYLDMEVDLEPKRLKEQCYLENETDVMEVDSRLRRFTNIGTDDFEDLNRQGYSNIKTDVEDKDQINRHFTNSELDFLKPNVGQHRNKNKNRRLQCSSDIETDFVDGEVRNRLYTNLNADIEDKDLGLRHSTKIDADFVDKEPGYRCYDDCLNVDARPLSFKKKSGKSSFRNLDDGLDNFEQFKDSGNGSIWSRVRSPDTSTSLSDDSGLRSIRNLQEHPNNDLETRFLPSTDKTWKRSDSSASKDRGINEINSFHENANPEGSNFRTMFDRLSSKDSVDNLQDSGFRSMWRRSPSNNRVDSDTDRPSTPGENGKSTNSGLRSLWNRISSKPNSQDDDVNRTTSGDKYKNKSCPPDRNIPTPEEHSPSRHVPGNISSNNIDKEQSGTQEIKRLLDGQASKSFKCVNGMDFLRMASMRSLSSKSSRKSSWADDSDDCDSEDRSDKDDYDSS